MTDTFAGQRNYDSAPLGNRAKWVLDEIAKVKQQESSAESCEQVTTNLYAAQSEAQFEEFFQSKYQGRRVRWTARVVAIESYDLTPGARQKYGYLRPAHGAILHYHCNPESFTEHAVEADGAVLFDGDNIDRAILQQFRKGDKVEFDATLATVVQWITGRRRSVFLSGISFDAPANK